MVHFLIGVLLAAGLWLNYHYSQPQNLEAITPHDKAELNQILTKI